MTVRTVLRGTAEIVLIFVILCGVLCVLFVPQPTRRTEPAACIRPTYKAPFL